MHNLGNTGAAGSENPIQPQEGNIPPPGEAGGGQLFKKLPPDVLKKIMNYLDPASLSNLCSVSKDWKTEAIEATKSNEALMIKNFVEFLSENLRGESYANTREGLRAITPGPGILPLVNLKAVKASILRLKEEIVNWLKNIDEVDLKRLIALIKMSESQIIPDFCENIFDLTWILKGIEGIDLILWGNIPMNPVRLLFEHLIDSKRVDLALEAANMIPNEHKRDQVMQVIVHELTDLGQSVKAKAIAEAMPNESTKAHLLYYIAHAPSKF
ncbi:MAG: F-box protein [Parachlamydiaceae bacterium]